MTSLNQKLVAELRELARGGASTAALVSHIRKTLRVAADSDGSVVMLAYLCRAFAVPLSVILPLREDQGTGAFGRALQVAFWFFAALTDGLQIESWDWDYFWTRFGRDFSADRLEALIALPEGSICFTRPAAFPLDTYARVRFEIYVDQQVGIGPSDRMVQGKIKQLAADFLAFVTDQGRQTAPVRMKFEYQIEDQGPKLRVLCMVHALTDACPTIQEPATAAS